jgi:hypothetical protein
MTNSKILLAVFMGLLILILLSACTKDNSFLLNQNESQITQEVDNIEELKCMPDSTFWAISEGLYGYLVQLRDTSKVSLQQKMISYSEARELYPTYCSLCVIMSLQEEHLRIDSINVQLFFNMLINHKATILSDNFSECYLNTLQEKLGQFEYSNSNSNSRWFLAALAATFGAGPCITGPLAILDGCVGIASGILTAPTGAGAIACWGGAAANIAYGFSTIPRC